MNLSSSKKREEFFISELKRQGFSHLNFALPEKEIINLYNAFNDVFNVLLKAKTEVLKVDRLIKKFIDNSNSRAVNGKTILSNIAKSEYAFKGDSKISKEPNVLGYQYVDGLYEIITQKGKNIHSKIENFLFLLFELHKKLKENLGFVLKFTEKKVQYRTILKVWKHTPVDERDCFLPLHCDWSVFTAIIHTLNSLDKECLKLYIPQTCTMYCPKPTDFPFLIPGQHAEKHFKLTPTPHWVEKHALQKEVKSRYSIVFFIVDPESL